MSAFVDCPSCQFGNHDGHIEWMQMPPKGGVGGIRCPCPGGCVETEDARRFLRGLVKELGGDDGGAA